MPALPGHPPPFGASADDVRRFYDAHTPLFLAHAGPTIQGGLVQDPATGREDPAWSNRFLAGRAGIRPGDRVLDGGCGVCGPAVDIALAVPDVEIDGVTSSPVQAELARHRVEEAGLQDRVRVWLADYHATPFSDESFDVVVFFETTGYSPDLPRLMREVARVLRPGGRVYVKDVFRQERPLSAPEAADLADFERLWCLHACPGLAQLEAAMRDAGLADVGARPFDVAVTSLHFIGSTLTVDLGGGVRVNAFGERFGRVFSALPCLYGEARARRPGRPS